MIPSTTDFDYNEVTVNAFDIYENAVTMSEFREEYVKQIMNTYADLPSDTAGLVVDLVSGAVLATEGFAVGMGPELALHIANLSVDTYGIINKRYLGIGRDGRVALRTSDYMEYMGYW